MVRQGTAMDASWMPRGLQSPTHGNASAATVRAQCFVQARYAVQSRALLEVRIATPDSEINLNTKFYKWIYIARLFQETRLGSVAYTIYISDNI